MPKMDEGAVLIQKLVSPEASLDEVDRVNHRIEDALRESPEVDDVVRRNGRAERTEDPMPHTLSDVLVVLKKTPTRNSDELVNAMRKRLATVPGATVLFTTPLGMRIERGWAARRRIFRCASSGRICRNWRGWRSRHERRWRTSRASRTCTRKN